MKKVLLINTMMLPLKHKPIYITSHAHIYKQLISSKKFVIINQV